MYVYIKNVAIAVVGDDVHEWMGVGYMCCW